MQLVKTKVYVTPQQCIMEDNEEEVFPSESSSDDENDTEDLCDTTTGSRVKRETLSMNKPNCYWPPMPGNTNSWPSWTHLRPVRFGNPTYGPRMQLFSSTGWHLAIYDRRIIRGSADELDRNNMLSSVPGTELCRCTRTCSHSGCGESLVPGNGHAWTTIWRAGRHIRSYDIY